MIHAVVKTLLDSCLVAGLSLVSQWIFDNRPTSVFSPILYLSIFQLIPVSIPPFLSRLSLDTILLLPQNFKGQMLWDTRPKQLLKKKTNKPITDRHAGQSNLIHNTPWGPDGFLKPSGFLFLLLRVPCFYHPSDFFCWAVIVVLTILMLFLHLHCILFSVLQIIYNNFWAVCLMGSIRLSRVKFFFKVHSVNLTYLRCSTEKLFWTLCIKRMQQCLS